MKQSTQQSQRFGRGIVAAAAVCALGLGSIIAGAAPAMADTADGFEYEIVDGKAVILGCEDTCPSELTIPAEIEGSAVTDIASNAFENENLTSVVFDEGGSLEWIGDFAFAQNQLTTVSIPPSVSDISNGAFQNNDIVSVFFSNSDQLKYIRGLAFAHNGLTFATIPASVTLVGDGAFMHNDLTQVAFVGDSQLDTIGAGAFGDNALTAISIPEPASDVGDLAFANNPDLATVRFSGGKPQLGDNVFENTGTGIVAVRELATPSWVGTAPLDGRDVVLVPMPVVASQPSSQTLPVGGTVELTVGVDATVPGQGDLTYTWFKDGVPYPSTAQGPSHIANSTGVYHVMVTSWVGSSPSAYAQVSAPVVPPKPAPKPKPVVKKKQSAKVKLPSKLKRNKSYKLPAKTNAGVKISWKVSGSGRCKIDKRRHTIKCRATTGKKHFRLTGTAKATSTYNAYKTTIKRRVK